jgi:YtkA-like
MRLAATFVRAVLTLTLVGILLSACGTTESAAKPSKTSPVFHKTLKTSDGILQLQFSMTPNHFGQNMFIVNVQRNSNGKPVTDEQAQIFTTMLDMDMGTGVIFLQSNGNGRYSASGMLPMYGNWDIHIQLLDATDTAVHVAKFKVYVAA